MPPSERHSAGRAAKLASAAPAFSLPAMPPGKPRFLKRTVILAKLAMALCAGVFIWWQVNRWHWLMRRPAVDKRQPELAMLEFVGLGHIPPDRLRLVWIDGPEETGQPAVRAKIMAVNRGNSIFLLATGEDVPQTDFRVESIQPGKLVNGRWAVPDQVVIANKRNGRRLGLPFGREVDISGSSVVLRYNGEMPGGGRMDVFTVRLGDSFMLPPENGRTYRVLDIRGRGAVVEFPDGTKRLITEK